MVGNKSNWTDIPAGWEDPLNYAVTMRDSRMLEMIADAVDAEETTLAFQPVFRADSNQVAFYEGLFRVYDPSGRLIPAADFILPTEAMELGRIIDCVALDLGLQALEENPQLRLSINMSARSIGYPHWMEVLRHGLAQDATVGERLILEISERSAMQVPELVTYFMRDLQSQGISFALDDFGSGYTSFRYLKDFYFDILKIDGSFSRGIANSPDSQVLLRALMVIADQLDMFTVAEAVESEEDAKWLAENGVEYLQGFYFAAPTTHPPWRRDDA